MWNAQPMAGLCWWSTFRWGYCDLNLHSFSQQGVASLVAKRSPIVKKCMRHRPYFRKHFPDEFMATIADCVNFLLLFYCITISVRNVLWFSFSSTSHYTEFPKTSEFQIWVFKGALHKLMGYIRVAKSIIYSLQVGKGQTKYKQIIQIILSLQVIVVKSTCQ